MLTCFHSLCITKYSLMRLKGGFGCLGRDALPGVLHSITQEHEWEPQKRRVTAFLEVLKHSKVSRQANCSRFRRAHVSVLSDSVKLPVNSELSRIARVRARWVSRASVLEQVHTHLLPLQFIRSHFIMVVLKSLSPPSEGIKLQQAETTAVLDGKRLGSGTLFVAEAWVTLSLF